MKKTCETCVGMFVSGEGSEHDKCANPKSVRYKMLVFRYGIYGFCQEYKRMKRVKKRR